MCGGWGYMYVHMSVQVQVWLLPLGMLMWRPEVTTGIFFNFSPPYILRQFITELEAC